jgi:hypothetical protein
LDNFSNWTDIFQRSVNIPEEIMPSYEESEAQEVEEQDQVLKYGSKLEQHSLLSFGKLDEWGELQEDEAFAWLNIEDQVLKSNQSAISAALEFATQNKSADRAESKKFAKLFVEAIVPNKDLLI